MPINMTGGALARFGHSSYNKLFTARRRRNRPLSHDKSMWSTEETRCPRPYPAANRVRLKIAERIKSAAAGIGPVLKAMPTSTLSKESARDRSSASFGLKTCKSSWLASSGER